MRRLVHIITAKFKRWLFISTNWQTGWKTCAWEKNEKHIDGVVDMTLELTQTDDKLLSSERLYDWHSALFFPCGLERDS